MAHTHTSRQPRKCRRFFGRKFSLRDAESLLQSIEKLTADEIVEIIAAGLQGSLRSPLVRCQFDWLYEYFHPIRMPTNPLSFLFKELLPVWDDVARGLLAKPECAFHMLGLWIFLNKGERRFDDIFFKELAQVLDTSPYPYAAAYFVGRWSWNMRHRYPSPLKGVNAFFATPKSKPQP